MVIFIPTPIGNILDITYRAVEVLQKLDLIFCEDTRVTKNLLKLLQERLDISFPDYELVSFNEHNAKKRLKEYGKKIKSLNVGFMSDAGMPAISDPGSELVRFCQAEKIEYDFLPGASVAPLVYAASGFESGKFYFYGFLPSKGQKREKELLELLNLPMDIVLYEAPHRIIKLLEEIVLIDEQRELFVAKELTKKFQRYFFGSAKEILQQLKTISIKGEWALVIKAAPKDRSSDIKEILSLDLAPKKKAKLLAKATNRSVKEWYDELTKK